MLHTLKFAIMLEEAGFSRAQAETSIKVLTEVMEDKLATKDDIKDVRGETQALREEMRHEFRLVRQEMQQMKSDLIIKMGAMQAASIAIIVTLIKVL